MRGGKRESRAAVWLALLLLSLFGRSRNCQKCIRTPTKQNNKKSVSLPPSIGARLAVCVAIFAPTEKEKFNVHKVPQVLNAPVEAGSDLPKTSNRKCKILCPRLVNVRLVTYVPTLLLTLARTVLL